MKRILLPFFLFLLMNAQSFAQDGDARVERFLPKISLTRPAFEAEFGLGHSTTVNAAATLGWNFRFGSQTTNNQTYTASYWSLAPLLEVDLRHYYNLKRRQAEGKDWQNNSADFIAGQVSYAFNPVYEAFGGDYTLDYQTVSATRLGILWGMQRTIPRLSNFYIGVKLGLGLNLPSAGDPGVYFIRTINLGWAIKGKV